MASLKLMKTKTDKLYYQIYVSRGRDKSPYKMRWYCPDGWSKKAAEREAWRVAADFEQRCRAGEVLNRKQKKEVAEQSALEAQKLKTVKQYAYGVYMPIKEATFSENSKTNYRMFLDRFIVPVIGNMLLTDVTPAIITKLLVDVQKSGRTHATCVKLYNILNGLFDMAYMDDSIPLSPMLKVKRPAPRKDEKAKQEKEKALTVEELRYVLSCVTQEPLKWQAYINLSADTGARRGEVCALQWNDIEWKTGTITIRRNLQYTPQAGVYECTPKSGKSRVVDIGPETLSLLRQLRSEQATKCISKWVFTQDELPDPMNPQSPTRYFSRFGKKYGIKDFHPHKLRHTSASIAITAGADVVSVSERLGHADASTTLKMYAHANEESIRRAGEIVRKALKAENE